MMLFKSWKIRLKWEQTYFTWDFSGEVAVGGEFETAGVLGGGVYNVNVSRLPTDRKTDVTSERVDPNIFPQFTHFHTNSNR